MARLLSIERTKFQFLSSVSKNIVFMYTSSPAMLTLNPQGALLLGIPETTLDPATKLPPATPHCKAAVDRMIEEAHSATAENPIREFDLTLHASGQPKLYHCELRAIYLEGDEPEYVGVVGMLTE